MACHVCRPISESAFSTEFSALFSWVRPVLVSSPQCDGSDLRICFFSSSFPPCVGWGVAPSRCSCGLGGWWRGENRGSGSALAANSALDRVSSPHWIVSHHRRWAPQLPISRRAAWDHRGAASSGSGGSALAANSALDRVSPRELGTPAAGFAQDRVGSRRSVVRLRTLHVQFWDHPQSCSLWLFPFCFPQLPTRACSG